MPLQAAASGKPRIAGQVVLARLRAVRIVTLTSSGQHEAGEGCAVPIVMHIDATSHDARA
jgi:hypothetical protein